MKYVKNKYYNDLYIENYTYPVDIYYKKDVIENTLNYYIHHHPTFNINQFNQLSNECLEQLVKDDKTICIDNQNIYKELYKIIWLIDCTFEALSFIKRPQYPKKYFAQNQSDKKKINTQLKNHKKMIVGNQSISSRGEIRANWYFYNLFKKNKELSQFFMNLYTIVDIQKASFLYEESIDIVEKTLHFFEDKLIQKTTKNKLIKSLGILLHYEFKNFLNIKDTQSKELIAEIIPYVFDVDKPNDEEFNQHIYLSSTLSFFPIFGASSKNPYSEQKQQEIKRMFIKILKTENYRTQIKNKQLNQGIKELLEQPHNMFLQKYPVEFFRINPKYSTLIKF